MDDPPVEPSVRKSSSSSSTSSGSSISDDNDVGASRLGGGSQLKASDSDIHTDRDYCSSDESGGFGGPDSPSGLKRAGSVYDFRSDGTDSPPPCSLFNGETELTKVARKRLRMVREVDVAVCHLNHTNTIISKILSSKYLRRWENHLVRIQDDCVSSNTPTGFLAKCIGYEAIKDLYPVKRWDSNFRYCLRVVVTNGSYLLQTTTQHLRDQILYSILWKKNVYDYQALLKGLTDPEDMLKELHNLVEFARDIPLIDDEIFHVPCYIVHTIVTQFLPEFKVQDQDRYYQQPWEEDMISTVGPLIEDSPPSAEMCSFLSHHCKDQRRLPVIKDSLSYTITRILKHNFDFARTLTARTLVQDYIKALYIDDQKGEVIKLFLSRVHSASAVCPHNRVLPNLVSICITAIFSASEELPANSTEAEFNIFYTNHLRCYIVVLQNISEYSDWLYGLAQLLRPLPFPVLLLIRSVFMEDMSSVILKIGLHENCNIHKQVLAVRETKDGWFDLCSPLGAVFGGSSYVWTELLKTLMDCERCKKKKLLKNLKAKHLGTCVSEALKNNKIVMDVLCLMLEWMVVDDVQQRQQIVDTLKSTEFGRQVYDDYMLRQSQLHDLQRKGGPQKLDLPYRGTDLDLSAIFGCGPFGNLESINLSFTNVTDTCAKTLIKLPSLKLLNLWGTQFGDFGLLIIADHLTNLQVLNLCETKVTDRGIVSLISLVNLKKLNLNSTRATVRSVDVLKKKIPGLHEVDVRYTDAWL
ncbi:C-Maf-inducing protein-like isoform X2 [Adelges cooleyi]|nr:C-Maf-inducing protein-like isoform X2 [Adelges cooleyi]XP_050440548.1 C-Maf-inducing protein-like isoform X2 [Adelges cooleyi]